MKNKGLVESGLLFILGAIVSVVASTGMLFGGANPTGAAVFSASSVMVAYSQMPHVKRDFRERKAVEEFGITEADAQALSDDDLLVLIRDDDTSPAAGNGGNFVNGYMNLQ